MTTGIICGNFDCLHPGYIRMFSQMNDECDSVIVLLHTDPSIERPHKLKPILSVEERIEMLHAIKYVDRVETYTTEADLISLILKVDPTYRFLGDDYRDERYTGDELNIEVKWITRDHGWSTTKYKQLIAKSIPNGKSIK